MGAPDLIARLSALGVRLSREGDGIRVAPRSALTDEARTLIREHKAELLAALPTPQQPTDRRALEVRRLIEAIALANASYWKPADVEEAYRIALCDLDRALECFRAIAESYGIA